MESQDIEEDSKDQTKFNSDMGNMFLFNQQKEIYTTSKKQNGKINVAIGNGTLPEVN